MIGMGYATGAAAGGIVEVSAGGALVDMQAPRDLTIATGDPVLYVLLGSVGYVLSRYFPAAPAAQPDNQTPPPAKPTSVDGIREFTPTSAGTYRSGWLTDGTVRQGNFNATGNNTGAVFYGAAPRSLDGATVTAATVRIRRQATFGPAGAQPLTLRLITESDRPAGAPTLTSSTAGPSLAPGQSSTFTIPTGWAQDIVDGAAGGLGVFDADGSPYVVLDGLPNAWTLTIDYTRTI